MTAYERIKIVRNLMLMYNVKKVLNTYLQEFCAQKFSTVEHRLFSHYKEMKTKQKWQLQKYIFSLSCGKICITT
jgi:hypothetical protein